MKIPKREWISSFHKNNTEIIYLYLVTITHQDLSFAIKSHCVYVEWERFIYECMYIATRCLNMGIVNDEFEKKKRGEHTLQFAIKNDNHVTNFPKFYITVLLVKK